MPAKAHPSLGVAAEHGACIGATPMVHKNAHTPAPLGPTGNNHKTSGKRSCVDSSLESVSSDQSQMAELAKGSHDIKLAHIELKHWKMEHKASEHTLIIKKEMQQQELASKERMMQLKIELARTKGSHDCSTNMYANMDFSHDPFAFGTGAMSTVPSVGCQWTLPKPLSS